MLASASLFLFRRSELFGALCSASAWLPKAHYAWPNAAERVTWSRCACPRRFAHWARAKSQRAPRCVRQARATSRRRTSWRPGRCARRSRTPGCGTHCALPGHAPPHGRGTAPSASAGASSKSTARPRARNVTRRRGSGGPRIFSAGSAARGV
jgi:hypothetical protein